MVQHFHHSIMWIATFLLKCRFTSIETIGLLGTGAHDVHIDVHIFHLDVQLLSSVCYYQLHFHFHQECHGIKERENNCSY